MTSEVIDAGDGLPLTVPELLRARAGERPDDVLLVSDDDSLTYAEADRRSAELAKGFLASGLVGKGTHVGILHPNGSAFAVAWLAAARVGAVSVPLSTFSTATELAGLLRGADVAVLVSALGYRSHDYVQVLRTAVPELDLTAPPPLHVASTPVLRLVAFDPPATVGDPASADHDADATTAGSARATITSDMPRTAEGVDPAWTTQALIAGGRSVGDDELRAAEDLVTLADRMVIVHTSGSTSAPKGVIHTHGALIRHQDNLNQLRRYVPGEVLFSSSPFFWIGGFAYVLLGTLVAGAKAVCSSAVAPSDVLDVIERERPTMVNGFAASVAHLPDDPSFSGRDLSSIRRGNLYPIMPPEVRPADPGLRHGMLGMTEAGSVCLVSEDDSEQPEHRRGSFGKPAPGLESRLVDGVLQLRGPFLMEGYYGRERHETFDPDGWFDTGDLFEVDSDGFHYFKGRRSDMIKTSGANVSPREVEAAILDAAGLVAHVVGIDDESRGQLVAAAVRSPAPATVDVDSLRTALRERLSAYKVPRRIVALADDEVPTMSSGKLDLRALRALLSEAP
jgi:acyl-CoA synthetase (AMP-forming)/AMP-acid ligase II